MAGRVAKIPKHIAEKFKTKSHNRRVTKEIEDSIAAALAKAQKYAQNKSIVKTIIKFATGEFNR